MSADAPLPLHVNPWKLAYAGGRLEGRIGMAGMRRLEAFLERPQGDLQGEAGVYAVFTRDAQRRSLITGSIRARLPARCQRCLRDTQVPVEAVINVAVIAREEVDEDLPRELEPLVVTGDQLDVAGWIEDELILAVPVAPRCEDENCSATGAMSDTAARDAATAPPPAQPEAGERRLPFAGLRSMMDKDT